MKNKVTGTQCYEARSFIGLSISAVASATAINRNMLSQFEKEVSTLTDSELDKLQGFYEERGYNFKQPETVDTSKVVVSYKDAQSQLESVDKVDSLKSLTQVVSQLANSVDDLVVANGYVAALEQQEHDSFINYLNPIARTKDTVSLYNEYDNLNEVLTKHFTDDYYGEMQGKTSFFGDSAEGRGEKLMALLALQQLRLMKAQGNGKSVVELNLATAPDNSDMKRLLQSMHEKLELSELREDLPEATPELIS